MSLLSSLKRSSKCGWTTRDGASTLSKSGSYHKQTQRNANFDKTRSGKLRFWRMYCREYLPSYISPEWFQKRITISKTLFGGDSLYNPAWRSCVSWVRMEKSDPNIFGPKWWWKMAIYHGIKYTPQKINGWNLKIAQLKRKIIFQTLHF